MEWEKVIDEADPDRCEGVSSMGIGGSQCLFKRVQPSKFCPRHGGNHALVAQTREKVRNYHLTKWRARVNEFADNPEVKSLREEIGIIRMMIEAIVEKCEDTNDLILYSGKLQELIGQAQKLVEGCHKLEERTGVLLDKQSILVFCDSAVKIIAEFVEDPDALDTIALRLVDVVAKIGGLNDVTANVTLAPRAN